MLKRSLNFLAPKLKSSGESFRDNVIHGSLSAHTFSVAEAAVDRVLRRAETITGLPNRVMCDFNECSSSMCMDECVCEGHARWCTPKKYSPSKLRKHRALGHLNPSLYLNEETEELYEASTNHVGRLWFVLNYSKLSEQLTVCLIKARNLRAPREANSGHQPGDCFVKIFLELDERRTHTTTCKKKTINPNFQETFHFQISSLKLDEQCLKMAVYHSDKQKHHMLIGVASYFLKDLTVFDKDMRTFRDLQVDSEHSDTPEIKVALTLHGQDLEKRVTVGLFEVRNLPLRSDGHICEVYAKVALLIGLQGKEVKCKRTEILNNTSQSFNESFTFKINDLEMTVIRIILMYHNSAIGSILDKEVGSIVIGSELFTKRRELDHWREMCTNPEQQVVFTHTLLHS